MKTIQKLYNFYTIPIAVSYGGGSYQPRRIFANFYLLYGFLLKFSIHCCFSALFFISLLPIMYHLRRIFANFYLLYGLLLCIVSPLYQPHRIFAVFIYLYGDSYVILLCSVFFLQLFSHFLLSAI